MNLGLDNFTKKDLPNLESKLTIAKFNYAQCEEDNYHKDIYSNSYEKDIKRIQKLISLIHEDLQIEDYKSAFNFLLQQANKLGEF